MTTPTAVCTSVCTSERENYHDAAPIDPDLVLIVARWLTLPDAAKTAIVTLVLEANRKE